METETVTENYDLEMLEQLEIISENTEVITDIMKVVASYLYIGVPILIIIIFGWWFFNQFINRWN